MVLGSGRLGERRGSALTCGVILGMIVTLFRAGMFRM
jgi:hypothetical protein